MDTQAQPIRRVGVLAVHSSPLAPPGVGDSGGMNVTVRALAGELARAGILDEDGEPTNLEVGIVRDPHLTERQKQVLIDVYRSFRVEGAAAPAAEEAADRKEHP